jgi:hypothetical protein
VIYRLRLGVCSFGTPSINERPSSWCLNEALGIGKAGVCIYKSDPPIVFIDVCGEVRPKALSFDSPQAIRELNIKAKNWKDLLTDEPFTRGDLITIQDPNNVDKSKLLSEFDHVKQNLGVDVVDATQEDPTQGIRMSEDHKRVFQSLNTDEVSLHAHKVCRRAKG